jgi:glycosyltransferase involved in cell wall biosynthesis
MSAERLVIASKTKPVEEAIAHGENGLLVDFFDVEKLSKTVIEVLLHPADYADLCRAARRSIIDRLDLRSHCLPQWVEFAQRVVTTK